MPDNSNFINEYDKTRKEINDELLKKINEAAKNFDDTARSIITNENISEENKMIEYNVAYNAYQDEINQYYNEADKKMKEKRILLTEYLKKNNDERTATDQSGETEKEETKQTQEEQNSSTNLPSPEEVANSSIPNPDDVTNDKTDNDQSENNNTDNNSEPETKEKENTSAEETGNEQEKKQNDAENTELFQKASLGERYRFPTAGNKDLYEMNEHIKLITRTDNPELFKVDTESAIEEFHRNNFFRDWQIKTEQDGTYKDTGIAMWKTTILNSDGEEVTHGYSVENPIPKTTEDQLFTGDQFYDNVTQKLRMCPDSVLMALQNLGVGIPNDRKLLERNYGNNKNLKEPLGIKKSFFEKNGTDRLGTAVLDIEKTTDNNGNPNFKIISKTYNIDYDRKLNEPRYKTVAEITDFSAKDWDLTIPPEKQTETRKIQSFFSAFNKNMLKVYNENGFNLQDRIKNAPYEQKTPTNMDLVFLKDAKREKVKNRNEDDYGFLVDGIQKEEFGKTKIEEEDIKNELDKEKSLAKMHKEQANRIFYIEVGSTPNVPVKAADRDMLSIAKSLLKEAKRTVGDAKYQTMHMYCEKYRKKSWELTSEDFTRNIAENMETVHYAVGKMLKKNKELKFDGKLLKKFSLLCEDSIENFRNMIAKELDMKTVMDFKDDRKFKLKINVDSKEKDRGI